MRRAKYLICMLIMMHAIIVAGQSKTDLREIFASAEGDILFEDYAEALPKYLNPYSILSGELQYLFQNRSMLPEYSGREGKINPIS